MFRKAALTGWTRHEEALVQMAGNPGGQQATPSSSGLSWMFVFLFMMLILFNSGTRQLLGEGIGVLLNPLLAGDGTNPMWSLFFGIIIVASLTQTIRHFMTDWLKMAENQNYMKAFNKELSEPASPRTSSASRS